MVRKMSKTTYGWETFLGMICLTNELKLLLSHQKRIILMKITLILNGKIRIVSKYFKICNSLIVNKFKKHLPNTIMTRISIKKCWKKKRKYRIKLTKHQRIKTVRPLLMLKARIEMIQVWTQLRKMQTNKANCQITNEELPWLRPLATTSR